MEGFVVEIKEPTGSRILDIVPNFSEDTKFAWELVNTNKILVRKVQMKNEFGLSFSIRMAKIAKKMQQYYKRSTKRP